MISVLSARPEATNTCTFVMSALRIFLISASVKRLAAFCNDFAAFRFNHVTRKHATRFTFAAFDGFLLIAQVDRRIGREHLDGLDALTNEAILHFFRQLVTFAYEQLSFRALTLSLRLFWSSASVRIGSSGFTVQRDVFGNDGAEDFTLIVARFANLHQVEFANGEEQPEDVAIFTPAKRAEQRRGGEFLSSCRCERRSRRECRP